MSTSSKSISSCSEDDNELRRGPWTLEEDTVLTQYIASHGEGRWNLLAKCSGLRRKGKSCRLRWLNYLKPDVKRGNFSPKEQLLILELHSKWGNRWARIAQHLPGRTDNEIKNYWRTRVQKQARHLKAKEASSSLQGQAFALPLDSVSQDSLIETTETQIVWEEACMNEAFLDYSYEHEPNSYSEPNNSSYMSSSESANIPKVPQHLGYSDSSCQFHALDNNDFNTFAHDDYFVTNNGCEMETFNLAESSWATEDFACNMWNMDELWQFRNLQK